MAEGELPAGWVACKVGEVIQLHYGKSLPARDRDNCGTYPVYGSNGVVGFHSDSLAHGPTIVLGRKGSAGAVHFSQRDCWPIDTTYFVLNNRNYNIRFIYFLLNWLRLKDLDKSTAIPGLNRDDAYSLTISLPPLLEQQRIVEKIETLFAELHKGEEALRAVQKLLARYRQSVLKAAVTGTLTADWRAANPASETGHDLLARILEARRKNWKGRGRYQEPVAPNVAGLPDLPEGWTWASVDQLLRRSLANGRSVPDARLGYPVLRLTALKDGRVDLRERKIGAWHAEAASNFNVQLHDILVSRGNGSKRLVGLGGIVSTEPDGVAYPDTMIRLSPSLDFVWAPWLIQIWNSPFVRSQIEGSAKTTAGIYKINQDDIRGFAVPLPALREQQAIAAAVQERLSQIEVAMTWAGNELKRSAALRQSILKDAFSGKLVPQDPSDEPADKLLDRIKATRASRPQRVRRPKAHV